MEQSSEVEPDTAAEPARVLVVGDDAQMTQMLSAVLRSVGYQVRSACSNGDAVAVAERWAPALLVQDGFEITRHLRGRRQSVPAILLTPGSQPRDRFPGLTIGGGDYLTKPFSPEELIARIGTVLRRTRPQAGTTSGDGVLRFADLELEEDTYDVRRAGQSIQLTPTEFSLLRYLMHNPEKVLSRAQILDHVWPYGYSGHEQIVESYIFRLRRKVDQVHPRLIHTVRGVGYSLRLPRG